MDLDGTVYVGKQWLPNSRDAVLWFLEQKIPLRFITNTTTVTRDTLCGYFKRMEIEVKSEDFFTPLSTAVSYILKQDTAAKVLPLVRTAACGDLKKLNLTISSEVDYVIIGEMGQEWTIDLMNLALRAILNGATLIPLHRNKYHMEPEGFCLGPGPFVKALEFATGSANDLCFGKPNKAFFEQASSGLGLIASEIIVAGDDLESDVKGAIQAGYSATLVKTGKSRPEHWSRAKEEQIPVIEDISDLTEFFK
jgi:HAD superfamily hydrolase (TIGR01458 family)